MLIGWPQCVRRMIQLDLAIQPASELATQRLAIEKLVSSGTLRALGAVVVIVIGVVAAGAAIATGRLLTIASQTWIQKYYTQM